jgi:hypothetical protein
MTERNVTVDAAGCLGRALTVIGMIWIGFVVLGGIGLFSELGWSGGFAAGLGGSIVPGLFLIFAGRALRRRSEARSPSPNAPAGTTPPRLPGRTTVPTSPRPAQKAPIPYKETALPPPTSVPPVTEQVEPVILPPPEPVHPAAETRDEKSRRLAEAFSRLEDAQDQKSPFRPKSSQEMIDEAKKRWGRGDDQGG